MEMIALKLMSILVVVLLVIDVFYHRYHGGDNL